MFVYNNILIMKKILLLLLSIPILFNACINKSEKNTYNNSPKNNIKSFNVTSKNPELTTKSGQNVSLDDMITKNIKTGDKILFKSFYFTLENKHDGAFNFYSKNGKLIFNTPIKLSIMSMPPTAKGLTTYKEGDNIEIDGTTLIKVNSINFVISDITD